MKQNWNKFALLMWKNWILQIRSPVQTVFEILLPVIFALVLVLIRGLVDTETNPATLFTSFDLEDFPFSSNYSSVAYSPCSNDVINTIMNNVAEGTNLTAQCYDDSKDLEVGLWNSANDTLAGIEFSDSLSGQNKLDTNLTVAIRFPAELRNSTSPLTQTWATNIIFPIYQLDGPREPEENMGASPNYFNEGFLTLQYRISKEIIKYHAQDAEFPTVFMQRFPYPSWFSDPLQTIMQSFASLLFMIGFSSVCINTVKAIATEKEKQLKEVMRIMGLTNWLHWTAWFMKTFILILVTIILIVIVVKVQWYSNTNTSVFNLVDPFVLLLFLIFYAISTITFCFAVSVFFAKANTATVVGGLVWFLSYMVYQLVQNQYATISLSQKMLICLASNAAMAYGFQLILMWEGAGKGLDWSNVFNPVTPDDSFTLGHVMIMLLVDAIIYLLIALYVEAVFPGDYGVPLVWYYPFTQSYWFGNKLHIEASRFENLVSDVYEKEPANLEIGVQINKLTKIFPGKKVAVEGLSFNMFEGQITALLGHNGAGKTTTMSMLTGMITPTTGTAIVNGNDIRRDMMQIRQNLGLCPQHNILFDNLTVAEHLYFYSKLKGLERKEVNKEIDTYIQLLDLVPKRTARAKTLSGGMKRKLNVAIALCGKSKICMLDEPTAGMDPVARRALWDMIKEQKKGRTILLSTHFMDEADLLGDRIAIMAGGKLQCCGTSFFLKKKYGAGYHLIMDKSKDCNVNKVTELLKRYIPDLMVETNIGSKLSYILAESQSSVFEEMLNDLENCSKSLGINSYGISLTTMEEVFMKVGAEHAKGRVTSDNEVVNGNMVSERNGDRNEPSNIELSIFEKELLSGFSLWKNQFLAMMLKKMFTTYRNWHLLLIQNVIPIVMLAVTLVIVNLMDLSGDLPRLNLSLDAFAEPVTVVTSDEDTNLYYTQYLNILKNEGRITLDWNLRDMVEKIINETIENASRVRMSYIIGASFHNNSVVAWFNNEPYHSPPISLQYSMNTILQQKTDTNHFIQFVNYPLPYSAETQFTQMGMGAGFQIAFNLGFALCFVMPFYILFCIKERSSKSKHLQFVSGVGALTFWITAALWDFITFQVTSLCILITIVCFQEDGFSTAVEIGRIYAVLLLFVIASLPLMYLVSFLFDQPATGFSRISLVNILTGPVLFMVVQILYIDGLNLKTVADSLHYIFSLLPHYSLAAAFNSISVKYSTISLCDQINSYNISACLMYSSCCDLDENYFNTNDGVGLSMLYMAIVSIVATCGLLSIEYQMFDRMIYMFPGKKQAFPQTHTEEIDDNDVLDEMVKVRNGEIRPDEYDIVLKNLSKQYSNFYAVNQLCVGIKGYECFGLLGVNGAGKTTTFKMMTGDVTMTSGDAWIRNSNLKTHMKDVYKNIGYCPQFDALTDELTGKETLIIYCLLRGIPYQDCLYVSKNLSNQFDFGKHLNKQVKQFSGGSKRKLSAAISLIGDPAVIFLDEPTAGMDPGTKRHLWNTLCNVRDRGKCLVLTSHSMEECEALCTRLAIMVNGTFKCIGSTQHLKNKFSEGYMLVIKVKKVEYNSTNETLAIQDYINSNFPTAVLREVHQELLTYFIADMSLSWSKIFGIMEHGKRQISNLEDYSVGQPNLEQIFLSFTKGQRKTPE